MARIAAIFLAIYYLSYRTILLKLCKQAGVMMWRYQDDPEVRACHKRWYAPRGVHGRAFPKGFWSFSNQNKARWIAQPKPKPEPESKPDEQADERRRIRLSLARRMFLLSSGTRTFITVASFSRANGTRQ